MPIHKEVLKVARRLCRERGEWTFSLNEIVCGLPQLNESTVRTHVGSRCCVNAPKNHPHKWDYFRRVGRGLYEILPSYRKEAQSSEVLRSKAAQPGAVSRPPQSGRSRPVLRDAIHAIVHKDEGVYVAECLEVAVVTQGRTVDELIYNLKDAIALHLDGEDLQTLGLSDKIRLVLTYETPLVANVA